MSAMLQPSKKIVYNVWVSLTTVVLISIDEVFGQLDPISINVDDV